MQELETLWVCYPLLFKHNTWSTKEKAKCAGIHKKTSWLFVSEMACVKDRNPEGLVSVLQRRVGTGITAKAEVDTALKSLKSMPGPIPSRE